MKIKKIIIIALGILILTPAISYAVNIDDLMDRPGESTGDESSERIEELYPEAGAVGDLPEVSLEGAVTTVIQTILSLAMAIALVAIVLAGIYYLKSEGDEEQIGKAKNILIYLLVGMIVMAAAYGVVTGVAKFNFFEPPENLEDE